MCGISGYLDMDGGVRTAVLREMNDVIRHRGPDDEGYALIGPSGRTFYGGPDSDPRLALQPLESADGAEVFLGFGHRRLSILDLSPSGHQPMCMPERDLTVTYNGEIYNYLELREELTALGYQFQTSCDTEILLKAYCQWGEDCLDHFNGMWGFALWDGKEKKLFCARDRLGAKPLHYWHQGNKLLFGSELKQLCQDDRVERRFDASHLTANMIYRLTDATDRTLIEGMRILKPGHKLVVKLSDDLRSIASVKVSPYWELKTGYDEDVSEETFLQQVAEEFSRSCRWRLRSDAPLAALLSGGLDSSCLVTELCEQLEDPAKLETFTTSYPGHSDCDEWYFADLVNKACGCRGNQILPNPTGDIERRFEHMIWHVEGFGSLSYLGPQILLEEIQRRGYKVVLNGQCGDETMFGYERYYSYYFFDLLKQGKLGTLLDEYRLAARHSKVSAFQLFLMFAYFNLPIVRDTRQLRRSGAFIQKDLLDKRNEEELHSLLYPKSLQELQKTELAATQLPIIVRADDRLYMASSLESRIPFMDYKFVELSARIPPRLKIQNGYTKNIMREIFDSRMPKEVTWRTNKMGFGAPVNDWAKAFSAEYLREKLDEAKTAPYFHMDVLKERFLKNQADPSVLEFLQLELFARQYGVN